MTMQALTDIAAGLILLAIVSGLVVFLGLVLTVWYRERGK